MSHHPNPIKQQIYLSLPESMYSPLAPRRVGSPTLLALNHDLLAEYGLAADWFESTEGINALAGNGDYADLNPIAMAYAGHQFGYYSPQLGDGRAHMLGQLQTADGKFIDVQLKGSGRTPYSRGGDGLATVGAVMREYLVSEALAGLGIATTRTLAILSTGESVFRDYQMVPGGIQVRTAASHIRVGSFQYASANLGESGVKALADHLIEYHFPELAGRNDKYPALLEAIAIRQAKLIASWMLVGFIHGVMNTDNMSLVGETIDFGPCAFMDEFKAGKVFSSIDRDGRYAWDQQANIGYWNLSRLAETLLPLFDQDSETAIAIAEERLSHYISTFQNTFHQGLMTKLGITSDDKVADELVNQTLPLLESESIDFTVFFDALTRVAQGGDEAELLALFTHHANGEVWLAKWQSVRDNSEESVSAMRMANPALIARNHQVEKAIEDAMERNDFTLFNRLAAALKSPFEISEKNRDLQAPPQPQERVLRTFCGT